MMRRVIILQREYWSGPPMGTLHTTYRVLWGYTDKKLKEYLDVENKPYRTRLWYVIHDFKLDTQKGYRDFLAYCAQHTENIYDEGLRKVRESIYQAADDELEKLGMVSKKTAVAE